MEKNTIRDLRALSKRYSKYGCTLAEFISIIEKRPEGSSEKGAVNWLRMTLGNVYKVREYFSAEDVAEMTGMTVNEVNELLEEKYPELVKSGGIMRVSSPLPGLFN